MENFIPRKYNSHVMIGLSIAVVALIVVVVYMYLKKDDNSQQHHDPHSNNPHNHKQSNVQENNDVHHPGTDLNKPTLVLFWGDWCGYSKQMKPEWDKAADLLNSGGVINAIDFESKRDPKI